MGGSCYVGDFSGGKAALTNCCPVPQGEKVPGPMNQKITRGMFVGSRDGGDILPAAMVSAMEGTLRQAQNCVHKPGTALHTQGHLPGHLIVPLQEREDQPGEMTERHCCTIPVVVKIGQDVRVLRPELDFCGGWYDIAFFPKGGEAGAGSVGERCPGTR